MNIRLVPNVQHNNRENAAVSQEMHRRLLDGAHDIAAKGKEDLKEDLSIPVEHESGGTVRSAPGEAPRRETGHLQKSVDGTVEDNGNSITVTVSVGAPGHGTPADAVTLEEGGESWFGNRLVTIAPRPFMRPAFEKMESQLPGILAGYL